jgi:hypothetical protein
MAGAESWVAPPSLPAEPDVAPERSAAIASSEDEPPYDQPCASRRESNTAAGYF